MFVSLRSLIWGWMRYSTPWVFIHLTTLFILPFTETLPAMDHEVKPKVEIQVFVENTRSQSLSPRVSPTRASSSNRFTPLRVLPPVARCRKSQSSPRMASSLDNVDLWEESDTEDDSHSLYDKFNGVTINPRNTIDLSDLRKRPEVPSQTQLNNTFHDYGESTRNVIETAARSVKKSKHFRRLKKPQSSKDCTMASIESSEKGACNGSEACDQPDNELLPPEAPQVQEPTVDEEFPRDGEDKRAPNTAAARKVKFNNLVTVKDGELSTQDFLRNSHNSAQLFKQKYLQKKCDSSYNADFSGSSGSLRNRNYEKQQDSMNKKS